MSNFDMDAFVADPTWARFEGCTKTELGVIAGHYSISVSTSLGKSEYKAAVLSGLLEQKVFSLPKLQVVPKDVPPTDGSGGGVGSVVEATGGAVSSDSLDQHLKADPDFKLNPLDGAISKTTAFVYEDVVEDDESVTGSGRGSTSSSPRLEARFKLRLARLQCEEKVAIRREEREEREKDREFQLSLKRLEAESAFKLRQLELQESNSASNVTSPSFRLPSEAAATFNVGKHISLVPLFREAEVEAYFAAFERIAHALHWPHEMWAILLQCKLTGKAQEACASLSIEESLIYDNVKSAVLRVYELVPEAYRQRFRNLKKTTSQTCVDFSREEGILFDRWCSACKVDDFASLRELVLIEQFKACMPERTVVYLNEQKVSTLQQAAVLADEFALTHKHTFVKHDNYSKGDSFFSSSRESTSKTGDVRGSQTHTLSSKGENRDRTCYYCKKPGHIMNECFALKRRQEGKTTVQKPKGVGLIGTVAFHAKSNSLKEPDNSFKPFIFDGFVSLSGKASDQRPVRILRDTGGSQSFILSSILPLSDESACESSTIVRGIEMGFVPAPLHNVHVKSDLMTGLFSVAVRPCFPVDGVDFIMGNDIAGGRVYPVLQVVNTPVPESVCDEVVKSHPDVFSVCALTRAQVKKQDQSIELSDSVFGEALAKDTWPSSNELGKCTKKSCQIEHVNPILSDISLPLSREALISAQESDSSLSKCFAAVASDTSESSEKQTFLMEEGVLMRKWVARPGGEKVSTSADWNTVHQIVLPVVGRRHVLELAHVWSGHLGIAKTYDRILQNFFWPGLKTDVNFCKTCSTCQVVGKPNQVVPPAPLHPIPAIGEPFEHVIVDCVGPLPRTKSGNQYMLTVMCVSTRFPEAIPLRTITAPAITRALTRFFTTFGLPKVVQSDQGSNFLSRTFRQALQSLGISHSVSSAYHHESQGALERWHQTLKSMLKKYCYDTGRSWDEGVPFVLFAIRDAKQESLGFSPAELVFGHSMRGPLKVLKEKFLSGSSPKSSVFDFVSQCRERLHCATSLAKEALTSAQDAMKKRFDRRAVERQFEPGDEVLVLLPTSGSALTTRFSGPYVVEKKVSDTNYVIYTPERRRKTRLCHINMMKSYHVRDAEEKQDAQPVDPPNSPSASLMCVGSMSDDGLTMLSEGQQTGRLSNSELLGDISSHLSYLPEFQRKEVIQLLLSYPTLSHDVPSSTNVLEHDIDVGTAVPIKQHAYRCPMAKREIMKKECEYLLDNGLAKPSRSPWSSPCLLAPKSDGTPRFCTDFRKVNAVTVPDSFPLPRMDDCIDSIGPAVFISKLDLLKGYWQVPLTERASAISAFVTPDHFLQYTVMAFGMRNAPATFQRLMHVVLGDVPHCNVYLDDVVVYSDTWEEHISSLKAVFQRLAEASLTLNLAKCEFGKATVTYLGKRVGHGQVRPVDAKVTAVLEYPVPSTRRELRRFLGMAGYYRCFCRNFSVVVAPLTSLCSPAVPFLWSAECQYAFDAAKSLLCSAPVLAAPNFSRPFQLEVDASAAGAGAVLLQEGEGEVHHPVCYFSVKFKSHQLNYSTIEKETLAMLLALQHFEVYVGSSSSPVLVYTDHNPLVFLAQMYNHNQRLMRWALLVQGFNIEIRHKKGADNVVADALSRG